MPEDRVYVNFMYEGTHMQAIYANITPNTGLSVGDIVRSGDLAGAMRGHQAGNEYRGLLEIMLRESADGLPVGESNAVAVNPALYFDLFGMNDEFLTQPMVNFFERNAAAWHGVSEGNVAALSDELRYDVRFALNLDLNDDEIYLRKLFEMLYYSHGMALDNISIDDVIQWNYDDRTITVSIFGYTHLFIPPDMCEEEALQNHLKREGVLTSASGCITPHIAVGNLAAPFINHYVGIINDRTVLSGVTTRSLVFDISFDWNEAANQYFLLSSAVERAGGSVELERDGHRLAYAHVSVCGVDVTFHIGTDGVRGHARAPVQVRADIFYRTVLAEAGGEMVFLSSHTAFDAVMQHLLVNPPTRDNCYVCGLGKQTPYLRNTSPAFRDR